jgi:hypothetical protein
LAFVSAIVTEADEVQRHWSCQLKVFVAADPLSELLRKADVPYRVQFS